MTFDFSLMIASTLAKSFPSIYAINGKCMTLSHVGTVDTPLWAFPIPIMFQT